MNKNSNIFIGRENTPLLPYLKFAIKKSIKIRIIVSFIMESGINLLIKDLKEAVNKGTDLKILTSNYMGITEPNALYKIYSELNDYANIKIFTNKDISFHPKTYFFEYADNDKEIIIGSSNISKSALLNGIEWNYKFNSHDHNEDYLKFLQEFNELYEKNSFEITLDWLRKYEKSYVKKSFFKENSSSNNKDIEPINFQVPALYELNKTREEGYDKALVIAATGLGKTFLAAFDSQIYNKVLFIAHREEILIQALKSFKIVSPKKTMGLFTGNKKEKDSDVLFATIQSISKSLYLNKHYFSNTHFDYIIIDEFHHSAAKSYIKLLEYFHPKFLLGMTATPDRMDNKDIYKLCDYNIAYECNFKTAINQEWLSPFRYYGIYDEDVDYDKIPIRSGKYKIEDLEKYYLLDKRALKIVEKYNDFNLKKTVGFCASIRHAEYMSNFFKKHKISSEVLTSQTTNRDKIINDFEKNKIKVLFTVDIFNEGIDIPDIDSVLFLRPTESYTIFIQQLGRGLRKTKTKEYLTVIDFVGNYKGAYLKPILLTGNLPNKEMIKEINHSTIDNLDFPKDCKINFDLKLVDIFKKMSKNKIPIKEILKQEYYRIKEDLQTIPTIMDIFSESNYPVKIYLEKFSSWLRFKFEINELSLIEKNWLNTEIEYLLQEIEKTSMTKSYKIPVLLSFIKGNILKTSLKIDDIIDNFKQFYQSNERYLIDIQDKSNKNWQQWKFEKLKKFVMNNPINFLSSGKSKEFFILDLEQNTFSFNNKIIDIIGNFTKEEKNEFIKAFEDRIYYRLKNYFKRKYL